MAPNVREKVRKLCGKLCSLAEDYSRDEQEVEEVKTPVHPRRFLITAAGRDEEAIEKMKHEFAKMADVNAQNQALNQKTNNMAETFNPIRREMMNSVHIEDEWDKYANPMITPNEARAMAGYPKTKVILYADNEVYEYDSGVDM